MSYHPHMITELVKNAVAFCFVFSDNPNITTHPVSITSPAGSNVSFFCEATGSPLPDIVWTKSNGEVVNHNRSVVNQSAVNETRSSTLLLFNITAEDVGSYVCYVNNSAGNETSMMANLTLGGEAY